MPGEMPGRSLGEYVMCPWRVRDVPGMIHGKYGRILDVPLESTGESGEGG